MRPDKATYEKQILNANLHNSGMINNLSYNSADALGILPLIYSCFSWK